MSRGPLIFLDKLTYLGRSKGLCQQSISLYNPALTTWMDRCHLSLSEIEGKVKQPLFNIIFLKNFEDLKSYRYVFLEALRHEKVIKCSIGNQHHVDSLRSTCRLY